MKEFLELKKDTEEKLGRQIEEKELEFLHWVYACYEEEQKSHGQSKRLGYT